MTLTTDTNVIPAAPDTPTSAGFFERTSRTGRRAAAIWALVVVFALAIAVLAVATFAGDDSGVDTAPARSTVAERIEHQAKLDGQARTYLSADSGAGEGFVAGSRRMPLG